MESNNEQIFRLFMEHNLDEIVRFHNTLRNSLEQLYADNSESSSAKYQLENYDNYLSANIFLMAYSHFDEHLYHLWKSYAKGSLALKNAGYSFKRLESILPSLGITSNNSSWIYLNESTVIRNCLLHMSGRISLSRNPDRTREIINKYPEELFIKNHDRLNIDIKYVNSFITQIKKFNQEITLRPSL